MHRRRAALLLALPLALSAAVRRPAARSPGRRTGRSSERAKERLAAREFAAAATDLERVRARGDGGSRSRTRRACCRRGRCSSRRTSRRRIEAARAFAAARPDSPFVPQARYVEARALLQLGKADEAAALLEARLDALLAPQRRGELAQAYLAVADEAFAPVAPPGGKAPAPEHERARQAYEQALTLGDEPLAGRADEVRYRIALCLAARGRHAEADAGLRPRPRRPRPGTPVAPALVAASLLREATSRAATNDLEGSRALLRKLREEQPQAAESALALEVLGDTFAREQGARRRAARRWPPTSASSPSTRATPAPATCSSRSWPSSRRPAAGSRRSTRCASFAERFPQAPQAGEVRFQIGRGRSSRSAASTRPARPTAPSSAPTRATRASSRPRTGSRRRGSTRASGSPRRRPGPTRPSGPGAASSRPTRCTRGPPRSSGAPATCASPAAARPRRRRPGGP
jgi:tetratricopeptide (TPR) repeat protein